MVKKENNQLVKVNEYNALVSSEGIKQVLQENVGGDLSPFDLDRVKIPAGGGTTWNIPTIDGEVESKDLTGVVVGWSDKRVFWRDSYSGNNTPPDCYSEDGEHGIGDPGGNCLVCPMAKFGTAREGKGRGQACKQIRLLFMMSKESILPFVVSLPPTSVQAIRKYFLRLAGNVIHYSAVETELKLEKTKNQDGIEYSRISASVCRRLDSEAAGKSRKYADELKPVISKVKVEAEDYAEAKS